MLSDIFKNSHIKKPTFFSRNRKLTFPIMLTTMIKKSAKSLQNTLNEVQQQISLYESRRDTVTASAYTQAREKLNYTAFIELSNISVEEFYEDGIYETFKGFRLLAVDGSIVVLPYSQDIKKEFTPTVAKNQVKDFSKEVIQARASVLYDVMNYIAIDGKLVDKKIGERVLAEQHLEFVEKDDLIIYDRGYPSLELFLKTANKANFLMRIRKNSFKEAKFLFDKNSVVKDIVLTIKPPKKLREQLEEKNLPTTMDVRFVQVILPTGEVEVLATSVLDNTLLKTDDFSELYFRRWEIETFYNILKNRLLLENFTGYTALAVKQDFYATLFLSNYESFMTYNVNSELREKSIEHKYTKKVNRSISFNTIKNRCFDLFYSNKRISTVVEEMEELFFTGVGSIVDDRVYKKRLDKDKDKTTIATNSANYYKRKKKMVG